MAKVRILLIEGIRMLREGITAMINGQGDLTVAVVSDCEQKLWRRYGIAKEEAKNSNRRQQTYQQGKENAREWLQSATDHRVTSYQ